MSGGVDSTAAALLLKAAGHELVGCTFRTRYTQTDSLEAAQRLAEQLHIPHHVLDYDELFDKEVVSYFCQSYANGETPNPCVVCNRKIKFGELVEAAHSLGCERLATGHYARLTEKDGHLRLRRAKDEKKDQTYFLWKVAEEKLREVIFPLGDMTKTEIRQYLLNQGFPSISQQTESQDICFIQDDYRSFLKERQTKCQATDCAFSNCQRAFQEGEYINREGKVLGKHAGFASYTIGQRKGLGIALGEPAFVTQTDAEHNRVVLGKHDDLYATEVKMRDGYFVGDKTKAVQAQIRYRSVPQEARWQMDKATLLFTTPVWGVTRGQSAVMYQDDLLVGGGIIV